MSFIISFGRSGGFPRTFTRTAWRICLGHVAITLLFHDIVAVLDTALNQEADCGSTYI